MNLILIQDRDLAADGTIRLDDYRADHVRSVLRSQPGDALSVGRINGPVGTATVTVVDGQQVVLSIPEWTDSQPQPTVDLCVALPRPIILRRLILTCGMMAVRSLTLFASARVEKSYWQTRVLQPDTIQRLLREGMSQGASTWETRITLARNGWLPPADSSYRLVADADSGLPWSDIGTIPRGQRVSLAIGPEGGWIDAEREAFQKSGWRAVSLGPWNLRVDTAVPVALAQLSLRQTDAD